MKKSRLEKHYQGDESWNRFVNFYSNRDYDQTLFERLLASLNGEKDLAIVILGKFRNEKCLEWINSRPNVLDGVTAIECLDDEKLVKRLRTALMRFPD